jgi:hypothetical protein
MISKTLRLLPIEQKFEFYALSSEYSTNWIDYHENVAELFHYRESAAM